MQPSKSSLRHCRAHVGWEQQLRVARCLHRASPDAMRVPSGERAMPTKSKSSTTTDLLPNPHPGEILMEEFLRPMALSQIALANAIRVPPGRINEIGLRKRAITADTDLRLARYFGMSEGFFLQLEADYELMAHRREIGDQLKAIR